MAYSVATAQDDLTGILNGTSLSKVVNLTNLMDRAARDVISAVDPAETKRIAELPVLYDETFDYACPADLKGDRIIDVRPLAKRYPSDKFTQTYDEPFDINKTWVWNGGLAATTWNTGIKSIRLAKSLRKGALLNACNSLTSNGTWAGGGDVTGLTTDTVNFVDANASLRFDLSGAGTTGYLECTGMDSVDLSDNEDEGANLLWFYKPTGMDLTSVTLRWGSSSTDYWEATVTANNVSTAFQDYWNLLKFNWVGASETGSPDASAIDYLRVSFVYDGDPATSVRLDNIKGFLGTAYQIEYYSKFLFRDATTGVFQETITDDTNLINLDTDSYNLYLYKLAELASPQVMSQESTYNTKYYATKFQELLDMYRAKYKSEVKKPQNSYYRMTSPSRYRRGPLSPWGQGW